MNPRILGIACLAAAWVLTVQAAESTATADHELLQRWETGQPTPVSDVNWTVDTATWELRSGTVRFFRPLADGTVTGFVFEGKGHFRMTVPDAFELEQLRRFAEDPDLEAIDEPFKRMVLRTSGPLPAGLTPPASDSRYKRDKVATKRHEAMLRDMRLDILARILAAHLNGDPASLWATMDTDAHDWLDYDVDPRRQEEIHLTKLQKLRTFPEVWVALNRPDQRSEPNATPVFNDAIDIAHVDLDIDLSSHAGSRISRSRPIQWDKASFKATVQFTATEAGLHALRLGLHPLAELHAVTTVDGTEVEVVREHVGERFSSIDNDLYTWELVVILEPAIAAGESRTLRFDYDAEIFNYASGRAWYPGLPYTINDDLHTAELSFGLPKGFEVRASGASDRGGATTWRVGRPTKMVGFSFGKDFEEERAHSDEAPEVIAFAGGRGLSPKKAVRNVAVDVAKSLGFFQDYFQVKFPDERIYVTGITGGHGQAFEGFIHFSHDTFESDHPGASELFRSHEVAHQIWGHMVRWGSYRDQWLSESFAEYSAMLYVEATMPGTGFFDDILDVYTEEQLGSIKGAMSKFARPWDALAVRQDRKHLGPIAAGYRSSTSQIPTGFLIQVYRKGPLVLHMIRCLLEAEHPGEDLFREVMRDFVATYHGEIATTADFQALLEKHSGASWEDFFQTWIYETAIPTYKWEHSMSGKHVTITVEQRKVPDGFSARVPVHVELVGGGVHKELVTVDKVRNTFVIEVEGTPAEVIFNPNHAVLARVKD